MFIREDRPPLWRYGKKRIAVYECVLDCGHVGGYAEEGTHALRRKCRECGGVHRKVVDYRGKEVLDA